MTHHGIDGRTRKGCYAILAILLIGPVTSLAAADTEFYSLITSWGPSGSSPGQTIDLTAVYRTD